MLEAGADVNAKRAFNEFGSSGQMQSGVERAWMLEPVKVYVEEYDCVYDVASLLPRLIRSMRLDVAEYLAVEIPQRQENCRNAIICWLCCWQFERYSRWIPRDCATNIARLLFASRRKEIWSFLCF